MSLLDLPSPNDEAWRWSDMAALAAAASAAVPPSGIDPESLFLDLPGLRLVFVNGECVSATHNYPLDVGDPALFMTLTPGGDHPLGALAGGRLGPIIRLGQGHSGSCVQIVHVGGGENHLPAVIKAWNGAFALVETFVGGGWTNRMTRVALEDNARIMRAVRLLQDDGFVSLREEAEVGQGCSLVTTVLAAGGAGSRIDGEARLTGEGAFAEYGGALLARGKQRHDVNIVLRHEQPSGSSRQVWRSVADGESTCSVAARVEVARDAQKTDGEQSLKGLLLSRSATINAKPELEIFADDVKCAHGATVGELDRNALFYLASRGVPEAEAKALLTRAFVADAIGRIGKETVREAVEKDVEAWFGGVGVGDVAIAGAPFTAPTPIPSPEGEGG